MMPKIYEEDRKKVIREIEQLQGRILQMLVPTILAFGLISFAGTDKINFLSLGGGFAVLFTSSLYVASASFKIFKHAAFLRVFDPKANDTDMIYWEKVNTRYVEKGGDPPIVKAETTAASLIYTVLALTFFSFSIWKGAQRLSS